MTLIIATKTITAVFGTMTLQLSELFQCSSTYSMKQTSPFFHCCTAFVDFIVRDCSFSISLTMQTIRYFVFFLNSLSSLAKDT